MDLPFEILVYIFKHLTKSDRKAASETCRLWYRAANDNCFLKNKTALFYKTSLCDENSPIDTFTNSCIPYSNYHFNEVEITAKLDEFWDKMGDNIKSLTLQNCDICEKVFISILEKCYNLESLSIISCRELFMSGRLLEGKTEGLLTLSLESLKCLNLSGNQYLTDSLVNRFLICAPILEHLDMSACSLQFHQGLVNKFYPSGTDVFTNPSESVLTIYFLLQFIMKKAKDIKHLSFSNTLIDGIALNCLSKIDNLKLESIYLNTCDQLTHSGIVALTTFQTSLKVLDLGFCSRVTDTAFLCLCSHLVNLEYLNIQKCKDVSDHGIEGVKDLKKLKYLNIAQCERITKDGLQKGLCYEKNVLEELIIHSINLDQTGLQMVSESLLNLKVLDISYCFNAVTDTSIQVIFKNQVLLEVLRMGHCDKVTDAGLTGMATAQNDNVVEEPDREDIFDSNYFPKIYLGSRAEEEIMRDARRKYEILKMCKKITVDNYTGFSLARLNYLRELDISGCNKISDVSLIYVFTFKELTTLNLSKCQQISYEGFLNLVSNCPSIEYLNLINCYNLIDEAVIEIAKGLKRLQRLELGGCDKLTDKTLQAVITYCHKLKYLDVQGCRKMSAKLACNIGLPTLHTVMMTKPGTCAPGTRRPSSPRFPSCRLSLLY